MFTLGLAKTEDIDVAMAFINQAKAHLKAQGIDQWQTGYPDHDCIAGDLAAGKGYFLKTEGRAIGYLCVDFGGEPAYDELVGSWKSSGVYAVVHRMAMDQNFRGKGLAYTVFALVEELCVSKSMGSIRVDTDPDNATMKHILSKCGFEYCGTIWFDNSEKIAFEKVF